MNPNLDNAPPHVKLAVDLIMLLEQNQVDAQVAVDALEIVVADFKNKLNTEPTIPENEDKK